VAGASSLAGRGVGSGSSATGGVSAGVRRVALVTRLGMLLGWRAGRLKGVVADCVQAG
jgi:hypothetical protein